MNINEIENLGQLLMRRGLVSDAQFKEAVDTFEANGEFFPKILTNMGLVTQAQLDQVVAEEYGMEFIELMDTEIQKEAIAQIKPSVARVYGIMPTTYEGNVLTIALSDPANTQVMDDLRFIIDCDIRGVIASPDDIESAINKYYGAEIESMQDIMADIDETMPDAAGLDDKDVTDIATLEAMSKEAPVIKLLNLVLFQAIKDRASDIHFEPFEKDFKIRYRIDGVLYEMAPPPKHLALALASRVKVMANLNIAETRLPQDGRIQMKVMGRYVDLRVSTLPTAFGESIVLRVLDQSAVTLSLDELGMFEEDKKKIRDVIAKPNGIFIVTGPTGSGKTTTLYSCLREINREDNKIITAEDPVEYDIDGICQVPIKESIGLTFAASLRTMLRQDPDVIFIGEIRDFETAEIAVQSSLTGHLVLSTLHTNDSPSSITRLIDMGVEPFLISSTLNMVLAQRLVRKLCDDCKEEFTPSDEELASLNLTRAQIKGKTFYRPVGCNKCSGIGYKGRCGLYEILEINDAIKKLILERVPAVRILQVAREMGHKSMRDDGLLKIYDGRTSIEEVSRET